MQVLSTQTSYLESKIAELNFPLEPANLYDPLRYFMQLGGKRMRPMLTLMGAALFGKPAEKALHAALAVEIFHNFSLIHDDIMDEAPLRRKKQTVHTRWNTNVAILSGDVLLVKAYQEICKQDAAVLPELLAVFNQTAVEVCEGQQLDMDFERQSDVSIPAYVEMIRLKTSVLLGCALEMGAIVAETSLENRKLIYEFGQHIGIAFQIQDDILDLYADPEKFGKQVGGDVLANKKTLLYLKAKELATPAQLQQLEDLVANNDPQVKVNGVRNLFDALQIKQEARKLMDAHYAVALKAFDSIAVPEVSKKDLRELAAYLLVREI